MAGLKDFENLTEIESRRNYNTKAYDIGGGKTRFRCHVRHIHYKNGRGFADIDTTLAFDNATRTWKHSKASYRPSIPEYADGWFEFYNGYEGANHTIKAQPIANHVKGKYFKDTDGSTYVLYKDAFGADIDLKVYAYWAGLKKVICINKKPADTSKDMTFDFKMNVNGLNVKSNGNTWNKTSTLPFKEKTIMVGNNGSMSYFRNAMVWDSGEIPSRISQPVDIELYRKNGNIILRKTITADILQKAVYPLYTDHPTTYYVGSGDGTIMASNASWSGARDATTGTATNGAGTVFVDVVQFSGLYYIYRIFLPINTNGITGTITDAVLKIFSNGVYSDTANDSYSYLSIVQASQASTTTLVGDDFNNVGDTLGSDMLDISGLGAPDRYITYTLNATGISWINTTGYTLLSVREGHDIANSAIASGKQESQRYYSSEADGSNLDPYLDITVGPSGVDATTTPAALAMTLTLPAPTVTGLIGMFRWLFKSLISKTAVYSTGVKKFLLRKSHISKTEVFKTRIDREKYDA